MVATFACTACGGFTTTLLSRPAVAAEVDNETRVEICFFCFTETTFFRHPNSSPPPQGRPAMTPPRDDAGVRSDEEASGAEATQSINRNISPEAAAAPNIMIATVRVQRHPRTSKFTFTRDYKNSSSLLPTTSTSLAQFVPPSRGRPRVPGPVLAPLLPSRFQAVSILPSKAASPIEQSITHPAIGRLQHKLVPIQSRAIQSKFCARLSFLAGLPAWVRSSNIRHLDESRVPRSSPPGGRIRSAEFRHMRLLLLIHAHQQLQPRARINPCLRSMLNSHSFGSTKLFRRSRHSSIVHNQAACPPTHLRLDGRAEQSRAAKRAMDETNCDGQPWSSEHRPK